MEIKVEDGIKSCRLDKFLSELNPELTRSFIQKNIKDGCVTVNNAVAKASLKVQAGGDMTAHRR